MFDRVHSAKNDVAGRLATINVNGDRQAGPVCFVHSRADLLFAEVIRVRVRCQLDNCGSVINVATHCRSHLLGAVYVDVFVLPPRSPLRCRAGILSPKRGDDLSGIEHGGTWEPAAFDRAAHLSIRILGGVAYIADHCEPGRKQRPGITNPAQGALRRTLIQSKTFPYRAFCRRRRKIHGDVLVGIAQSRQDPRIRKFNDLDACSNPEVIAYCRDLSRTDQDRLVF